MLTIVFNLISWILNVFNFLCLIRIIITWVPSLNYSTFARILSTICDPYLNIFRKLRWTLIGSIDFSPAIALCTTGALSYFFSILAKNSSFSILYLVAMLIQLVWSIAQSILVFFIIILIVRLVVLFISGEQSSYAYSYMNLLDSTVSSVVYNIARTFTGGRRVSYKTALIISIISLIVVLFAASLLVSKLCLILESIGF